MTLKNRHAKKLAAVTMAMTLAVTTGCGYFLYPERVGQTNGEVDPTVIILDGASLLFGIVPGVIAFAVDITTGAIYLPPGEESSVEKHSERLSSQLNDTQLQSMEGNPLPVDREMIAEKLSAQLGRPVEPDAIQYFKLDPDAEQVALREF